ncbi:Cytochrome P450 family protein [Quillaja saponaria]|uniref:Cytochrome P450 family protein n=1 Tax=Quillaja saponaria TaxID=32244 RepID=A0AAD7LHL5_QUISA|nr:Cytochrome P450 family protein [Quillaja saponaria]
MDRISETSFQVCFNILVPMDISTAVGLISLLVSIVIPFFLLIWRRRRSNLTRKAPPIGGGAWPIIGHLPLLRGAQLPHITLGAMADKYGPFFTIKLGVHPAVVVSNWKIAKECFTTNDEAVSSRPKLLASKLLSYNYAMFGFASYGPYWRQMRKIANSELLCNRRIQLLSQVRVSEIETSTKEIYSLWAEKNNGSAQYLVELKQWFGELTLNVVLRMICRKRYFGVKGVNDEKEGRQCLGVIRDLIHLMGVFVASDAIPCIGWLDLGGHEKAMKKTAKELDCILSQWLEEHRQTRASGENQDFMDVMLSFFDNEELHGFDADTIIKATALNMIGGASDTTRVTLTWSMSLLLNNLHVLKKAQEELDGQVGNDRFVKESDLNKLVYIQAIVKETLRLYPASPLSGPREFTKDCIISGYHVRKGTRLITNLWKIQTDPSIWLNPLEFKPERFLTTHKQVDVRGQDFQLIPFGSGRRVCPGISFGLQLVQLSLATFLHSFDISTPLGAPVDMAQSFGLTNMKTNPLHVSIKARLPSKLYAMVRPHGLVF